MKILHFDMNNSRLLQIISHDINYHKATPYCQPKIPINAKLLDSV